MNTKMIVLQGAIARKESGNSFIKQALFQGRLHSPNPEESQQQ